MLIKDLLKEFSFDLRIKNCSKRTSETYTYNVNQFIKYLEEQQEMEEIMDKTNNKWYTPEHIRIMELIL